MSKQKEAKVELGKAIQKQLAASSAFVLVDYKGVTVLQDTEVRNAFRKAGVTYKVYKNRLLKIALNNLGYTQFDEALNGQTAIAFAPDLTAPARVAAEKAKAYAAFKIKAGLADGRALSEAEVLKLAALPSKEILISQLLGLLLAPIGGLARTLAAVAEAKN